METKRHPLPPFTLETALQKRKLQKMHGTRRRRNRTDFINSRKDVKAFPVRKWQKELGYTLKKELWGFRENRMAVRFEYEWYDHDGQWFRSYGNELWEFDEDGYMRKRFASINDLAIQESDKKL